MKMSSHHFFYEDKDSERILILEDNTSLWPITLRIGNTSIYMNYQQLEEFITTINSSYANYAFIKEVK